MFLSDSFRFRISNGMNTYQELHLTTQFSKLYASPSKKAGVSHTMKTTHPSNTVSNPQYWGRKKHINNVENRFLMCFFCIFGFPSKKTKEKYFNKRPI